MHASTAKMISLLAVPVALGVCILPAAAQNASGNSGAPERTAQIDASFWFADVARIKLDTTEDEVLTARNADKPAFTGKSLMLTQIPLRPSGSPMTAPLSNFNGGAQNESAIAERTGPPIQRFVSRLNDRVHFPLLQQSTIENLLVSFRRKYGPESMTQSGNMYWFVDSQQLATGSKAHSLFGCSKMSRWWSICASANAKTSGVYFRAF